MGNMYDGWLESGIQDRYDDQDSRAEEIAYWVEQDLKPDGRCYPFTRMHWAEAISQLGLAEELQDNDIPIAPQELRDKVVAYWYDVAEHINERDCE
jgi:hypothetical protein